jgi:hypothetical protein
MMKGRDLKGFFALLPILVLVAFLLHMTADIAPTNLAPTRGKLAEEPVILAALRAPSNFDGVAQKRGFPLL